MKLRRFGRATAAVSLAALALTACGSDNGDDTGADTGATDNGGAENGDLITLGSGDLIGGGASSQESAMTAWATGLNEVNPELNVNYDPVGSGSGREGFINGQYSFAGSDSAMDADEQEQAAAVCGDGGVFHVPSYISPVAVAFNLEGHDTINMDAETIAKVFTGEITTWNDDAIASQNEDADLPDTAITVVHRADDSGTTENFTEYLEGAAAEAWTYGAVESWPGDITAESAQQTSGVVNLASSTEGAITYADASQIGDLGTVAVGVGEDYVPYSAEAAAKAVDAAEEDPESPGARVLDRDTEEEGVYPIVMISYHIFCDSYADQDTADQVKSFAAYVVSEEGQSAAEASAGNAPISEAIRDEAMAKIEAISAQG